MKNPLDFPVAGMSVVDNAVPTSVVMNLPHTDLRPSNMEPSSAPSPARGRLQADNTETSEDRASHIFASSPAYIQTPANMASEIPEMAQVRGERPMSPGTLALMCDEKDPLLTAPSSPAHENQLDVDQERVILSEFRDCLRRVISLGNRRG